MCFAVNKMLKWTQLLTMAKDRWVIASLGYLSEMEIVKERIICNEDGSKSVPFEDVVLVSKYDSDRRLISEDLAAINDQRSIEHQLLDNHNILTELAALGLIASAEEPADDKLTLNDTPVMITVKVLDPGQILLGKQLDQSRNSLELKKMVDFTDDAFSQLYRIAPVDTWAIFVERDQEQFA
jgi:hypothetical protein